MAKSTGRRSRTKAELAEIDREFREALSNLVIMWANAESWFHRVLAVILKIDVALANLLYTNTVSTRARVDLVQRCGFMCLAEARLVRHLKKLASDFEAGSRIRNKLCHATYEIHPSREFPTAIIISNFQRSDFDGTNYQEVRAIDRGLINEIWQEYRKAVSLCGRLERFVKTAPKHVLPTPRTTPLQLSKRRKGRTAKPKKRP
jgi:hypothetical protein